jgi:hypothetical protein
MQREIDYLGPFRVREETAWSPVEGQGKVVCPRKVSQGLLKNPLSKGHALGFNDTLLYARHTHPLQRAYMVDDTLKNTFFT